MRRHGQRASVNAVCSKCGGRCETRADALCCVCRSAKKNAEAVKSAGFKIIETEGRGYEPPGGVTHCAFEEHESAEFPDSSIRWVLGSQASRWSTVDYAENEEPFLLRPAPRARRSA